MANIDKLNSSTPRRFAAALFRGIGEAIGEALIAPVLGGVAGLIVGFYLFAFQGMDASFIVMAAVVGAVLGAAYKIYDVFN